jgi:hypothetical protein
MVGWLLELIGAPVVSRFVMMARSALTSSGGVFGRKNARGTAPNAARIRAFAKAFSLSSAAINAAVSGRIPRTTFPQGNTRIGLTGTARSTDAAHCVDMHLTGVLQAGELFRRVDRGGFATMPLKPFAEISGGRGGRF